MRDERGMTSEERARNAIYKEKIGYELDILQVTRLGQNVATAIRDAERDAIERAASIADAIDKEETPPLRYAIGAAIRELNARDYDDA